MPQGTSATTIKAECRRMMIEKIETAKGKFATAEFTVHVKDSIIRRPEGDTKVRLKPREVTYLHWDDKLTLEFNNSAPKIAVIEINPAANIPCRFSGWQQYRGRSGRRTLGFLGPDDSAVFSAGESCNCQLC